MWLSSSAFTSLFLRPCSDGILQCFVLSPDRCFRGSGDLFRVECVGGENALLAKANVSSASIAKDVGYMMNSYKTMGSIDVRLK